ncbi:MAG TPA: hypothetical protein ENK08_00725 [Chloroflexi bacterium]|nr:hypothetical protein [Chloroflexota bacterium]
MSWDTRRIVDLLRGGLRLYYRRKYGALARRIGRPRVGEDGRRGFIVVQIDGLAYAHLLHALQSGAMPYLRRLLSEHRLHLFPWRCGLPSSTPAVQAAIMFGTRYDIPGFRWYDKRNRVAIVAKRPDQMRLIQRRLRRNGRGILAGGSSYVNLFDGDADLALFTLSAFHPQRFFESVRGMGLLVLFLLSPIRSLRMVGMTLWEYIRTLFWRLVAFFRPTVVRPYDMVSPLLASAVNTLFTEVQTFGVLLDIYRRVPAIYTNYNTYDEMAHLWGTVHPMALGTLRDIDRRIRQIDRMRKRYPTRPYDLFVLSDHGNTPSVPFSWLTRRSLGRFIAEQLGERLSLGEVFDYPGYSVAKARYLLEELEAMEDRLPTGLWRVARALRQYVDRHVPPDREVEAYNMERREDVVVRVSGPLAHVYFNVTARPLELIEVALLYPHLVDRLLETEGIGLLAGRGRGRVVALGWEGGTAVIDEGRLEAEGKNPLAPYGEPEWVARELRRLLSFPHAGDLVILGRMLEDGRTVTFEEQVATHGGIGGPQSEPFIAAPTEIGPISADGPEALHHLFRERYSR